ncbi:MAG: GNAT family N-acetyltransferase [Chloroflexi bacterium HGW-Chloroflexi-10]|nr:MAG: GNAT family N-acetyltransferase [Chloroflexi bacterium HGW-Chloroflexi-10]
MIINIAPNHRIQLKPLFESNPPSFLIDTVIEGVLGTAWTDDLHDPQVAMLVFADIVAFGGDPQHAHAIELINQLPEEKGVLELPSGWQQKLEEVHASQLISLERYAFSDENLNSDHLRECVGRLPSGYVLRKIDLSLAKILSTAATPLSVDQVQNYGSPEYFLEHGIGYCILKEDKIVSGASSYASCKAGIEIQVNTIEEERGKGLAQIVSAALIMDCLEHGKAAHWDAANRSSARLAQRLGYQPSGSYQMLLRIPCKNS